MEHFTRFQEEGKSKARCDLGSVSKNSYQAHGWRYGKPRDDGKKIHPTLILYKDLKEEDKKKDRNSVRSYNDILHIADYKVVASLDVG